MFRFLLPLVFVLAACASTAPDATRTAPPTVPLYPGETPAVRSLVNKWADAYSIPRSLLHRVIQRESDYRPGARNGPYWGMMQILPATARGVNFRGEPAELLDAETHLKYATRYLRGAWILSGGDEHEAMMWYAKGYYYEAKRQGLLYETGLRGGMWSKYDAGSAPMVPIDAKGRVVTQLAEAECVPAAGPARLLGGRTCS
ncbi:lytic transglycosylase domain-containing protein [Jannaschia rubra]|uniref:Transglycosylase SLT domain protein n=1 Tax=Jannaschia rubra TaxID=282197 RepID=A0A0M6XMJ9_9RHOB|nr:lytic transglycosylase domain-containing protein [Jannaschia rubra]CTQ31403.1 Transglycosylase SLT domain protein [Jannaschia rubra]SFF80233.1 Transglycosylase SLT domain-containing protein [Jannaschia rubra]